MNTRYLVSVGLALALHGGLLFGIPKNPRPVRGAIEESKPVPFVMVALDPDDPEIVMTACGGPPNLLPPDAPRPAGFEPVVIDTEGRIPVEFPRIQPSAFGDGRVIVPMSFPSGDGGGDWKTRIIASGALDNAPRARFQAQPIYPFEEKRNGVAGEVLVDFEVDESGQVRNPRVVRSSARAFEEPTLRAVAKWRFEPGRRHGQIVAFRMNVPVIFSLNAD
jgi:protein TonB